MTDDLVIAVRRELANHTPLTDLLGSGDGFETWIFPGNGTDAAPYKIIEGTQQACLVIQTPGGWTSRNRYNSASFPRLWVDCYIDPVRDTLNQKVAPYLRSRFLPIWNEVDTVLNYPQGGEISWNGMRIVSSVRDEEWKARPYRETDGTHMSTATFNISL